MTPQEKNYWLETVEAPQILVAGVTSQVLGLDGLDGDGPTEPGIEPPVDATHRAIADLPADLVAPERGHRPGRDGTAGDARTVQAITVAVRPSARPPGRPPGKSLMSGERGRPTGRDCGLPPLGSREPFPKHSIVRRHGSLEAINNPS